MSTTVHEPLEIKVDLTSPTQARTGDRTLQAGTGSIEEAIMSHARRRAKESGLPVRLVVTAPTGKSWSRLVEVPPRKAREDGPDSPPHPLPRRLPPPPENDNGRGVGRTRPSAVVGNARTVTDRRAAAAETAVAAWRRRSVRYGAAATVLLAAFVAGRAAAGGGSTGTAAMAPDRPLETFSLAGPGDRTSGPGIIEASNYAYYVWPRTAAGVSGFWASGAAGPPETLQKLIDKAAADKWQFHVEVTETGDPLLYDARLTITTSDGVQHPYAQRYRLARADDGKYLIASKTDCDTTCPPL
ncbi:hypothetical protein [Nocardia sp. NPDC051570]|uniref:hypothetical protein n=1 Tax=Nocardia sp. NPDC051570 TaxID=3364324 RepID=UPI0037A91F35